MLKKYQLIKLYRTLEWRNQLLLTHLCSWAEKISRGLPKIDLIIQLNNQ